MKCPVCKTSPLTPANLEQELPAANCSTCGGNWVSSAQYWTWLEKHGPHIPATPAPPSSVPVTDSKGAKLCPECGHILIKCKVGHEVGFCIDECGACHGIWLDKNEWDGLKQHNLHDEIHLILDASWQRQIRNEASKQNLEKIYEKRFGPESFG